MSKIAIIGYGNMGSMLLNGFIKKAGISPSEIIISTYTKEKLLTVKEKWPNINIADENISAVKKAKLIFICVKPKQVIEVLNEIKEKLTLDKHIISIAGCITIENIEKKFSGKITKIIPSITSEVHEGVTLIAHNSRVTKDDALFLENLLGTISCVKTIKEADFEAATDLTSCAPGFISEIFQEFLESALRNSKLSKEDAEDMIVKTLYGTALLYKEKRFTFNDTIKKVARPGGITEEGVKVLKESLPEVFDRLFYKTLQKHEKVKSEISEALR